MGKYSVLCLNGGGVRGSLQVGALLEYGDLHFPEGIYGISIGSVIAALIAFQFTLEELEDLCYNCLNLNTLLNVPRLDTLLKLPSTMGMDTGEKAYQKFKEIFAKKNLDLDTLTIGDAHYPLYIIGSDLTFFKSVVFNETVPLWDAIRASISLPILFTPHVIRGRTFVDGGLLCRNIAKHVPVPHREKALFLLCNNNPEVKDISSYMKSIVHSPCVMESRALQKIYPKNVCMLTESNTDVLDIDVDVNALLEHGRQSYRNFLS
jgi:predicted acylesterase/phospholipase RssA